MTQNLTLVTQKPFGSLTCNFYKDDAIENEFYMTRRQIGEALGYVKADGAIQQIHDRNKDRLDPLSTTLTLGGVEGNRWVNRNTRVYTLRGVMEICRFSRQPNADKFMDFVWDVMESLYHGRSVLATPDQTSAVAMQTIQALVDSTLKTQAETTRCMVTMTSTLAALANHFAGAAQPAAAIAPQPVTVAPKDYAVHDEPVPSPKNESTPVPAPQKSNVSVAVTSKPVSAPVTWRDEVYQTMDKIIRNAPELYPSRRDILNQIYAKMKRDYGFVQEQERINYRKSHACTSYISTIQIIGSSTTYREIFDSILNDLYNDAIIKHVRKNDSNPNSQLPIGVQRELGLIKNEPCIIKSPAASVLDEQPVPAPLPDESAKQPKPTPSQSLLDERAAAINAAIAKAAAIYYDTSCNFSVTYRNVYKIMNTDWNEAHIQFRNRYNRTAQQLKTLVMYSGVLFDRFNAAVNTYINAASKPEVESVSKKEA
jgi:prophage antirepressor-like protein